MTLRSNLSGLVGTEALKLDEERRGQRNGDG